MGLLKVGVLALSMRMAIRRGLVFVSTRRGLEDETGSVNIIVWKGLRAKQRGELLHSRLMAVYGVWQHDMESSGDVYDLIARRLHDLIPLLGSLATQSRDFH